MTVWNWYWCLGCWVGGGKPPIIRSVAYFLSLLGVVMQAIRPKHLVLYSEWRTRDERSHQKRIQRSAEDGNGCGTKEMVVVYSHWIGEAERAWQLYRLARLAAANQTPSSSQGQRSENRPRELGSADRWNVHRVPMWTRAWVPRF